MKDAVATIEALWDRCTAAGQKDIENELIDLLKDHGISLRQRDGHLKQISLTRPTIVNSGYVIGIRYVKRDGSQAEDMFTVRQGQRIQAHYRGSLQKMLPEYDGTHHRQVNFASVESEPPPTTPVNTISQVKK